MALVTNDWSIAPSIFPIIPHELDGQIIIFLKSDEKVMFSGLCRRSYVLLSNAVYFKSLFEKQFPQVPSFSLTFETLSNFHPNNCWKVACCALSNRIFQPNTSFIKDATPLIFESLKKQKKELETDLNEICGYPNADPCSQLQIACESLERYKTELNVVQNKWIEAGLKKSMEAIESYHFGEALNEILDLCFQYGDPFFENDDGTLNLSEEQRNLINIDLIDNYRLLSKAMLECNPSFVGRKKWETEYNRLEDMRSSFAHSLQVVTEYLSSPCFSEDPPKELESVLLRHQKALEDEFYSMTSSIV